MNLEEQLRRALKRREPPAGFAERVLARAREQTYARDQESGWWRQWFLRPRWVAAAAAAAILLLTVGSVREYEERQASARAGEQVLFALELASSKVSFAQQKVLNTAAPAGKKETR